MSANVCRFLLADSDSDSEDNRRVVRSAKDRRFEELRSTCDEIRVSSTQPRAKLRTK